ncbi:MAG TPA: DUF1428 domain-containing protein [Phycisphaerales bacterium]|nr:DUF1428 domain-containing protein [Phycisphaerales bacterium]HMP37489.1 DUF1428 domain-containing protein [Phycisphaerales bacterium]
MARNPARYIDGFVIPIPRSKLAAYRELAKVAAQVWIEHGALEYVEAVLEHALPGFGLPFPKLVECRRGETVIFSYIVYRSRAHRDRVNAKVMTDRRIAESCTGGAMPFDPKRMTWGGFTDLVAHRGSERAKDAIKAPRKGEQRGGSKTAKRAGGRTAAKSAK